MPLKRHIKVGSPVRLFKPDGRFVGMAADHQVTAELARVLTGGAHPVGEVLLVEAGLLGLPRPRFAFRVASRRRQKNGRLLLSGPLVPSPPAAAG